jgi:hypothetical protein
MYGYHIISATVPHRPCQSTCTDVRLPYHARASPETVADFFYVFFLFSFCFCCSLDRVSLASSVIQYPSYGYEILSPVEPATTIWELWDSDAEGPGMNSRDHIMFGGPGHWIYSYAGGITQTADSIGYEHVVLTPPATLIEQAIMEEKVRCAASPFPPHPPNTHTHTHTHTLARVDHASIRLSIPPSARRHGAEAFLTRVDMAIYQFMCSRRVHFLCPRPFC